MSAFPPRWRRRLGDLVQEAQLAVRLAQGTSKPTPGPLVVSGFLNETLGIGRGGALTLRTFEAAGLAPIAHDLRDLWPHRSFSGAPKPGGPGGVWLLHCNAPEAIAALAKAKRSDWGCAYRIGYWAYELPQAPPRWLRAAGLFDEIWTPSRFVADALNGASATVRVMPHPVELEPLSRAAPPECDGLGRFILAAGDVRSSLSRKNILGAIAIFKRAVPAPTADLFLVIKLVTRGEDSAGLRAVRAAVSDRPDIRLITRDFTAGETQALLQRCAVLLHPHRAEGFGLMLAEALLLNVPVLATGWSGNLEFMAGADDLLIDFALTPVIDPDGAYQAASARWAEPNIEDAVAKLSAILDQPDRFAKAIEKARANLAAGNAAWSRSALLDLPFARYLASLDPGNPKRAAP
jgi:glycosyltransferase involved in cell wall biosynthesis